eukprot:1937757-Rhodomonas_salina.1
MALLPGASARSLRAYPGSLPDVSAQQRRFRRRNALLRSGRGRAGELRGRKGREGKGGGREGQGVTLDVLFDHPLRSLEAAPPPSSQLCFCYPHSPPLFSFIHDLSSLSPPLSYAAQHRWT